MSINALESPMLVRPIQMWPANSVRRTRPSSPRRRPDSPPGLAVFNCTELLAINATPKLVGGPEEQQTRVARRRSCRKRNNRGGEAATGGDDVVAAEEARRRREELQTLATQRVWELSASDEAIALAEVRSIGG